MGKAPIPISIKKNSHLHHFICYVRYFLFTFATRFMNVSLIHKVLRFFWLIMALHILNCSIDAPDGLPSFKAEDLSINEMESISEVVLEKCFGFEKAVPEHDENDQEEGLDSKFSKFAPPDWRPSFHNETKYNLQLVSSGFPQNQNLCCQYCPGTDAPPPKKV